MHAQLVRTTEDGLSTQNRWASHLPRLDAIQKRVLWLSTQIIHHANSLRGDENVKIGGHQASSSSVVSLLTALYFRSLRPGDRVAIKPHASPVFHAIQFLLGNLPADRLKQFRSFRGLQAYPSRTKDMDHVDFSTGSVGLGAAAPIFAALTQRFLGDHFSPATQGRSIALVGDAELDEGNIWEALAEDGLRGLGQVLWIVDLNRQSLDRVIPNGRAQKIEELFRIHDWHVIELKYGRHLQETFARPGGARLRRRIDQMSNEEYQCLLRLPAGQVRDLLARDERGPDRDLLALLDPYSDEETRRLLSDLGGHDLAMILDAYDEADRVADKPVVIVAYTVKGWGLPMAGDPLNHSKLLTAREVEELREQLGIQPGGEFSGFAPGSPEALYIAARRDAWQPKPVLAPDSPPAPSDIPESLDTVYRGTLSTQQALGSILTTLARDKKVAERIVTTSPDVAVSTNLGGWINKTGVYCHEVRTNFFRESGLPVVLNWDQGPRGQHIELGISENNFFLLLGMLGLAHELSGQTLLPVGTIYDTFIGRGLDALTYAAYSEAKFIFAGTPSGITLSREGGAHQSVITPSIGIEMPNLVYYEPCFARELEWILLAALRNLLDRKRGRIVYLRLSTQPVDQSLFPNGGLREDVLRGAYILTSHRDHPSYRPGRNVVNLFACGVMVPVAVEASQTLLEEGILANVVNVTSPDLLFKSWRQARKMQVGGTAATCHLERLIPAEERPAPIVTVMDGHSHALSFIGGVFGSRTTCLGVDEFGQSGSREDLYEHYGIDAAAIRAAAREAIAARN